MIDTIINQRYAIDSMIASGSMSDVYYAHDTHTDTRVAVKVMRTSFNANAPDQTRARFDQEITLLAQLDHPHIVRILDAFEHEYAPIIVMKYINGGTLQAYLAERDGLSIDEIVSIGTALCEAIAYAHSQGVIHRDLKPANILMNKHGTPYLTDFGTAHYEDSPNDLTAEGTIIGSCAYLSPEECQGDPATTYIDLWALGVILCEMTIGYNPFRYDNIAQILNSIINQPTPDLRALRPDLPPRLVNLIHSLLAKNPAERLPSAEHIAYELRNLHQGRRMAG